MDGYRKKPVRFECVFTRIVLTGDVPVTAVPDKFYKGRSQEKTLLRWLKVFVLLSPLG
jgi:hypothetical protein